MLIALLLCGCAPSESRYSGRFQLLNAVSGITLRIDTATGETWRLDNTDVFRWTSVADNLQTAGTYNPKTMKVEWGVKAPDGRDLMSLSKEELVRLTASLIESKTR
jgi:hypothetical protein